MMISNSHLRTSALLVEEEEDGMEKITGTEVDFLLVDLSDMAVAWMTEYDPVTDSTKEIIGFSTESLDTIPEIASIVKLAQDWTAGKIFTRLETSRRLQPRQSRRSLLHPIWRTRSQSSPHRFSRWSLSSRIHTLERRPMSFLQTCKEVHKES